jgi:hypothetical protein
MEVYMFEWMKSTRSIAVIMVLFVFSVVVFGAVISSIIWHEPIPSEVLTLLGSTITGVVVAYFGKRDVADELGGTTTVTQTDKPTVTTISTPPQKEKK